MPRPARLADQDVAFVIAQWCGGIKQKEIAGHFGYRTSSPISLHIEAFIRKYYPEVPRVSREKWNGSALGKVDAAGDDRKVVARIAFCHFMAQREAV